MSSEPTQTADHSSAGASRSAHASSPAHHQSDPARKVALDRLEDQIRWYDAKSQSSQRWFKILKAIQLIAAAAVPVVATLGGPGWLTGGLGALIIVLEGFQQLNQYQQNWVSYRSTCEKLRHEKFLFWAAAGPYGAATQPAKLLAERVESLISQEHANWVEAQEEAAEQLRMATPQQVETGSDTPSPA